MDTRRVLQFRGAPTSDAAIIELILAHEGGIYTNHPADRGGPTKWGITQAVLSDWLSRPATVQEVKDLTRETAAAIYTSRYIRPFDRLPRTLLRTNVIDMGVNAGPDRATRLLQQCLGVDVDGIIGPQTVRVLKAREDWNPLYVGFRLAFYESLIVTRPSQRVFRNGWRNRALSFYGVPRLRMARPDLQPAYGLTGKAYDA